MLLAEERAFMTELAQASGDFIRPYFANPDLVVETKEDESPVTVADRGAEELMRTMIARRFPHHGIVGEELEDINPDAEWVWVLDPIDGTKAFATACPLFGTLIALLHEGQPVLGAIHQPILRQLMIGDGQTTTLDGRVVRVRDSDDLTQATLLTSDFANLPRYQNGNACNALLEKVKMSRTWADCYGYLLLSSGWADICLDPIMNPWDIAALVPIVRGAGGIITNWQGGPAFPAESTVATTPQLHAKVLSILNS